MTKSSQIYEGKEVNFYNPKFFVSDKEKRTSRQIPITNVHTTKIGKMKKKKIQI